jgi:predicted nucleic acid-binding protein
MVELERILIEKIGFEPQRWEATRQLLVDLATEQVDAPAGPPEAVSGDPDDDLILACAIAAGVEVLVSGDRRHLLPLGEHRGVRIVTPQTLLSELRGL